MSTPHWPHPITPAGVFTATMSTSETLTNTTADDPTTTAVAALSTTETLTYDTLSLFIATGKPLLHPLPLPPIPHHHNLIPSTRFLIDTFSFPIPISTLSFFLSHFHSDHYSSLSSSFSSGIIFCSPITASLVVEILGVRAELVVRLPVDRMVVIDGAEVVLVDANHCPGAVMFLVRLKGRDGRVERYVHTGDFRYRDEMRLNPNLQKFVGCDAVFLDTTYCNPKYVFPSQQESIDYVVGVVERIKNEIKGNEDEKKGVLFLVATYVVGKEKILLKIASRCGCKIYVDERKMRVLRVIGYGDEGVFTEDVGETDVHVVGWNVLGETWPYFRPNFVKMGEIMVERGYSRVVGFVPTGWTYEVKREKFAVRTKGCLEVHLVPYSEHSNYEELREFVRFLKPKKVIPTVGVDVKDVDSKHVAKMRKHFAGLIDEMANKQEFLMGFRRKEERMVDDFSAEMANTDMVCVEELKPPEIEVVEGADPEDDSCSVSQPHREESTSLGDEEKEVLIKELHDCLPTWVARDQMLDLINLTGRNVVDAVSYFYEHETEFHEQSSACKNSKFTSKSYSTIHNESSSKIKSDSLHSNLLEVMEVSQSQNQNPLNLKYSAVVSTSPGKKKRNQGSRGNKKAKLISNAGGGVKQPTITNFFNKVAPTTPKDYTPSTSRADSTEPMTGKCLDNELAVPIDGVRQYEEVLDQFMHVANVCESARSYAASIIERTKGDINVALDIYYNDNEGYQNDNQTKLDIKPLVGGGGDNASCSSSVEAISSEAGKITHTYLTSSSENAASTFVSLPVQKYSPVEHACWKEGQAAPYIHLAWTFDLLESEKGKIKATNMLCNTFRSLLVLSPEDVLPAVYLCTNKIAPDHENIELNIGGSIVTAALVEACGTNRNKIRDLYNRLGDLGDVAQECRQTQSLLIPPSPLLIKDVFSALREISIQTGNGSTARKKSLILGLMRACRDKEMKFLVRTLVRNLRIGAMMKTVLPSLAQAVVMNSLDTSHYRGEMEDIKMKLQRVSAAVVEAYNILPNLDMLVPSLLSKGIEFSSSTLTMVPGIPIRPMLAKITNGLQQALKLFENKSFSCEYKPYPDVKPAKASPDSVELIYQTFKVQSLTIQNQRCRDYWRF